MSSVVVRRRPRKRPPPNLGRGAWQIVWILSKKIGWAHIRQNSVIGLNQTFLFRILWFLPFITANFVQKAVTSRWSWRQKVAVSDLYQSVCVWCRFWRICVCCRFLSMNCACFLVLSMKSRFLSIILANIRRMEVKSRWSERLTEAVSQLYYRVFVRCQFRRICACCSFLSMNCACFVDEIMVFGEYMSEYSSDGDEK